MGRFGGFNSPMHGVSRTSQCKGCVPRTVIAKTFCLELAWLGSAWRGPAGLGVARRGEAGQVQAHTSASGGRTGA